MLSTILKAFTVADIRKKLAFTAALLVIYRLGAHVPVPSVNAEAIDSIQEQFSGGGVLNLLNTLNGGGLSQFALFALGIMPYITASIILQLLTVVVPSLEKLQKEGEVGQQRITQYTRYLTVGLAFGQAIGYVFLFRSFTARAGQELIDNFNAAHGLRDRHVPHRRLRARHVARRADHPARHRQRHLADDLRVDRQRPAAGHLRPGGRTPTRSSS